MSSPFYKVGFLLFLAAFISAIPLIAEENVVDIFKKSSEADLQTAQRLFDELEKYEGPTTVETVLVPLNKLLMLIDKGENLAHLYLVVHPNAEIRRLGAEYEQEFARLETKINLSRSIFEAVSGIDTINLDAETKRFIYILMQDFRRAGVDRSSEVRNQIEKLQEELVKIGQDFARNIREDVRYIELDSVGELEGLPEDFINSHQPAENGKICITTDYPDYIPFMKYAKSDERRFELYQKNRSRGYPQNQEVLQRLLEKRYEFAQLLDYKDYAEYITEDKMVKNPRFAENFIYKVVDVARDRAEQDYQVLLKRLQKEDPNAREVGIWQNAYLSEIIKKETFDFDSKELRQYFQYENVKNGILNLTSQMFGVSYKKGDEPVWHPSVDVYEMWDGEKLLGRFYLDMHPRENKYKHAMLTEVRIGVRGLQVPEAALVCNFPGGDGSTGLMEHQQVQTFFHEFGHLLHYIFGGHQSWIKISGISTELDFVETPSNLLEEWAWDASILKKFAVNALGEPIPDDLVKKMNAASTFGLGIDVLQQMYYSAISLNFYNREPHSFDQLEMVRSLQHEITPFEYVDGTFMHLAFGHLDGYSSIYYTYKWSEVIAKDMFGVFQQEGLLNEKLAQKYRKTVLEPGGSKEANELIRDFLGRDFSFKAFANWLNN